MLTQIRRGEISLPYRGWLLVILAIAFIVSAIGPDHPRDFVLEHLFTALTVGGLVWLDRRRPISNAAATLIFLYVMLHILGAHYTYSKVPYDLWTQRTFGWSITEAFDLERNHFDRLVHFMFGLLLVYPARELCERFLRSRRGALILAMTALATFSMLYELLEWTFAMSLNPDAAERYNGQQGDVFDPQKDMALALAGSLISAGAVIVLDRKRSSRRSSPRSPRALH